MGNIILNSITQGSKVVLSGNSCSVAETQHFVVELLIQIKLKKNSQGISTITLNQDTPSLTFLWQLQ